MASTLFAAGLVRLSSAREAIADWCKRPCPICLHDLEQEAKRQAEEVIATFAAETFPIRPPVLIVSHWHADSNGGGYWD